MLYVMKGIGTPKIDISFNIEPSHHLTLLTHSSISIGVYNVTGRKNVYSIYYMPEEGQIKGYQMSIFGVPIPFFPYSKLASIALIHHNTVRQVW